MNYETLQADIKSAMINKDNIKRDCLRAAVSEIKNRTVNEGKPITDEVCMDVIKKLVKQHKDSIEQFTSGNRLDLVEKEQIELSHLEKYLPKMLSEDESKIEIQKIIIDKSIDPIKKNMGMIMKNLPSTIDKKFASKYLGTILK